MPKIQVFWYITLCRLLNGYRYYNQFLDSLTLKMEALRTFETSVLLVATAFYPRRPESWTEESFVTDLSAVPNTSAVCCLLSVLQQYKMNITRIYQHTPDLLRRGEILCWVREIKIARCIEGRVKACGRQVIEANRKHVGGSMPACSSYCVFKSWVHSVRCGRNCEGGVGWGVAVNVVRQLATSGG